MGRSVGVVIPAYKPDIPRLNAYLNSLQELGCVDVIHIELDTPSESTPASAIDSDNVNTVSERRGKGAAITAGFDALSTDILSFVDADGATPAESLRDVIGPVKDRTASMAVGSRRHPEANIKTHQTILRRRMGDVFAWIARQLLLQPLYDYQCGAKALSADAWEDIRPHLYESGFAWDLELVATASACGYGIQEVPVVWNDVPNSTVDPVRDTISMGVALLMIRHRIKAMSGEKLHSLLHTYKNPKSIDADELSENQ